MTDTGLRSRCTSCGEIYPQAPTGHVHKCGKCDGGICTPIEPAPKQCFRPGCESAGEKWPVFVFGTPGNRAAYRLEVAKAVCELDSGSFNPFDFLDERARSNIDAQLKAAGQPEPDWEYIALEWKAIDDPEFDTIRAGGFARIWWADVKDG